MQDLSLPATGFPESCVDAATSSVSRSASSHSAGRVREPELKGEQASEAVASQGAFDSLLFAPNIRPANYLKLLLCRQA